jgi:glutamate-1-semialdehyde 2,1-aminomutase
MTATGTHSLTIDAALRARAAAVIPGGMYGHQNAAPLPPGFPQFMARGSGARVWDVDGNEYVDLMCSYGPVILGHQHPKVDAAARAQQADADCQNTPSARMVELAEKLTATVAHADWAMFAKNGTDATTLALTIARAATGRRKILAAKGAYHGAAPWCTPRPGGTTAEDRAHLVYFTYNDLGSAEAAAEAVARDLAGVIVSPFRHDVGEDQELADPVFARGLRALCDRAGAALILDDVRCGFRLHLGGSWEPLGVSPDLSAWSKAIANGYALAALLGNDRFRGGATEVFTTGSFWFSAVSMAASLATLDALAQEDAVATMVARGQALRDGLAGQAARWELPVRQTGPVQMPFLTFTGDQDFALANVFTSEAVRRGAFLHPRHNWFVSAATTPGDIDHVLAATDPAFAAVRRHIDDGSLGAGTAGTGLSAAGGGPRRSP